MYGLVFYFIKIAFAIIIVRIMEFQLKNSKLLQFKAKAFMEKNEIRDNFLFQFKVDFYNQNTVYM